MLIRRMLGVLSFVVGLLAIRSVTALVAQKKTRVGAYFSASSLTPKLLPAAACLRERPGLTLNTGGAQGPLSEKFSPLVVAGNEHDPLPARQVGNGLNRFLKFIAFRAVLPPALNPPPAPSEYTNGGGWAKRVSWEKLETP